MNFMNESFQPDQYGQTVLNPLGIIALLVLGFAMLLLPRRHAVLPMIILGCFVSQGQRFAVLTLNFDLGRAMLIFGTLRVLVHGEWNHFVWKNMDSVIVAFAGVGSLVYMLQYGTVDALKLQSGALYDILGTYFLFRCLIRDMEDVANLALGFAVVSVPVAIAFLIERATHHNMFAIFGGVPYETEIREGKFRCQGAYTHPIIAGCYWASVLPLIGALWWRRRSDRPWAVTGIICGLIIIVLCASSTPISALICGAVGVGFFRLRRQMRSIRWILLATLIVLHLGMNAPVWHLIADVDLVGGSTGWDRYNLINNFITRVGEWWMLGTKGVVSWGIWNGDIPNQYVLEGVEGGIWTLALFIALIVIGFSGVGRLWRHFAKNRPNLIMSWALGVSLFIHVMSFIGLSYFGQITMLWYLTLAIIACLSRAPQRVVSAARAPGDRSSGMTVRRRVGNNPVPVKRGAWVGG